MLPRHHRQYLKDPMVGQVALTKQNMSLMRWYLFSHWYLCIILFINNLLQLVSSQAPIDPSRNNCLTAPCMYKGECRDVSDTCGATNDYCNSESTWVPACGGGVGLDRPVTSPSPPPQSPPTGTTPPTKMPTTKAPQTDATTSPPSRQPPEDSSLLPTTAWQLWISQQNGEGGDDEQDNEGANNDPASNETDWFNDVADSWGERFNDTEREDEGGLVDSFGDFWGSKNLARESPSQHILITFLRVTAVGAWAILF